MKSEDRAFAFIVITPGSVRFDATSGETGSEPHGKHVNNRTMISALRTVLAQLEALGIETVEIQQLRRAI